MEQKKFARGFLMGMICMLLIGGISFGIYQYIDGRERNQGAVTDAFVEKAKLIEKTVKE